jgi:peptidoglycan-N-acetylmuramic acid deacetylase PdaC-like protein
MLSLPRIAVLLIAGWMVLFASNSRADDRITGEPQSLIIFSEVSVAVDMHASLPRSATRDPQLLKRLRDEVTSAFQEIREQGNGDYAEFGSDSFNPYSLIMNWTERYVSDRYLSLLQVAYYYTGGAHGNTGYTSLVWDLSTGEEIGLPDILNNTDDGAPALKAIARHLRAALVEEKMLRNGYTEEEARNDDGLNELKATLDTMETFAFVPSRAPGQVAGLTFVYGPYYLGSYAEGDYQLYVPASVFSDFLQPEFAALFGGEPLIMETLSSYPTPGASILLPEPTNSEGLTSPLVLTGEAPDFWFVYGVAKIELYADDELIAEGEIVALPEEPVSGSASGMVRFRGEVAFDAQPPDTYGEVRFIRGSGEYESPPNKITWWVTFGK